MKRKNLLLKGVLKMQTNKLASFSIKIPSSSVNPTANRSDFFEISISFTESRKKWKFESQLIGGGVRGERESHHLRISWKYFLLT